MSAHRLFTFPRRIIFVALFALAAIAIVAALTLLPPTAGRTASAQATLDECHDLALEMSFNLINGEWYAIYRVGNRTDETLTNIKVVIQSAQPFQDGTTGNIYYTDKADLIVYRNSDVRISRHTDGAGSVWKVSTANGLADRSDWAGHWLMPTIAPAASHSVRTEPVHGVSTNTVRVRRNTVTMAQLAADGTTELCKTQRVYWTRSYGNSIRILEPSYGVALSVDNREPAANETVNFKVRVNARHGYGVNARVSHTSGLTLASTTSSPTKTEWKNYKATTRQGDFWIGTESVLILTTDPTPSYEITLPFQVTGAALSEQCVTATVTGVPGAAPRVLGQTGDDPSDNRTTLCLGEPPVFHEDGDELALWTLHPCVGETAHPCDSANTLEVASVDNSNGLVMSAGPADVNTVIRIDPVAGAIIEGRGVHRKRVSGSWVNNTSAVSWQTGREYDSHSSYPDMPGVKLQWGYPAFDGEFSDWDKMVRVASISGVGDGLSNLPAQYDSCVPVNNSDLSSTLPTLPDAPGGMMITRTSGGGGAWRFSFRPHSSVKPDSFPRYKRNAEFIVSGSKGPYDRFVELEKLGTYVVDFHTSAMRTDTTNHPNPYCDTMRTVFHAGPIAELAVSDGGANLELPSDQVAFRLNLSNVGPDPAEAAQVLVELPAGATSVTTIPANLGTFNAAGTVAGVSHKPYWLWEAGELPTADDQQAQRNPQGREVTLVVGGATAGDTATATVSNGNGHCKIGTTTLLFVIRTEDCAAVNDLPNITATWTPGNPYTLCLKNTSGDLSEVLPKPANETACTATSGNSWHAGTVLDHWQGNNTTTLTARSGGAGLAGAAGGESETTTTVTTYVTLNWPAAAEASEYRVFRSDNGTAGSYQRIAKIKAATEPTYTDDGANAGETYYYHVEALYPNQHLAESHSISVTATQQKYSPMAPGGVTGLDASRKSDDPTTINVSWTAPSNATGATRYNVEYRYRAPGQSLTDWAKLSTEQTETTYTLTGATGGSQYEFQVHGVNLVGEDRHPGPSRNDTVNPLDKPKPVRNLTATPQSDDRIIQVKWDAWDSTYGGTEPTHYEVQYQTDGGDWTTPERQLASVTDYQPTGVNGNHSYLFRVWGVAVHGDDVVGRSALSNVVPKLTAPARVGPVTVTWKNATEITVTWTEPSSGTPTGYHVQYQQDGGDWTDSNGATTVGQDKITHQFTGAEGNSGYQFQVRAYATNSVSGTTLTGDWRSSNTLPGQPPGKPVSVTGTRNTSDPTEIVVSWDALARANTYDVQYRPKNGSWRSAATGETRTSYTVSGLSAVTTYQFRVRGVNGNGNGQWTESGDVTPLPLQYNGVDVYVDYLTLKVTSGPWWYKYLAHDGWTSCAQVAAGGHHTIRNLIPEYPYRVDLFKTSACDWNDSSDFFQKVQVTMLSDITDWGKCWNTTDCRSIDNPNDFNNHTHKRRFLGKLGETTSGCDWSSRVQHNHGWPSGHGPHWHCETR